MLKQGVISREAGGQKSCSFWKCKGTEFFNFKFFIF